MCYAATIHDHCVSSALEHSRGDFAKGQEGSKPPSSAKRLGVAQSDDALDHHFLDLRNRLGRV